jgi:hypothetical protein
MSAHIPVAIVTLVLVCSSIPPPEHRDILLELISVFTLSSVVQKSHLQRLFVYLIPLIHRVEDDGDSGIRFGLPDMA